MRRLFGEGRKADTEVPALGAGCCLSFAKTDQVDGGLGLNHAVGVVAAVIEFPGDIGEGHLVGGHQVIFAHLRRFAPDGTGDGVDGQFHGETDAGPGHATIGGEGRFVGGDRPCLAAVDAESIGAGQVAARLRSLQAGGKWPDRIGADIDSDLGVKTKNKPAFIGIGRDLVVVLPGVCPRHQMFAAIFSPADRPPGFQGHPGHRYLFRLQHAFVAKAAADIGGDHPDLALIHSQAFRQTGTDQMWNLGRSVDDQLPGLFIPMCQSALALHRIHALPGSVVFALDHNGGPVADAVDVAVEFGGEEQVVAPVFMQKCRTGFARFQCIDNRRQRLKIDLDHLGDVLGLGARGGDADGNAFADKAHLVLCQRVLVGGVVSRQGGQRPDGGDIGQIGGREHPAGKLRRFGDALDTAVRDGTAHECGFP